jgi:hypothetical protein
VPALGGASVRRGRPPLAAPPPGAGSRRHRRPGHTIPAREGKPEEGVVVVEVLGVVDEQLHVGSEGAPRLLADVLSSLIRVGLGLDR